MNRAYINAANDFEKVERLIIYFKTSNYLINKDFQIAQNKITELNNSLEIPYTNESNFDKETLDINFYEMSLGSMMYIKTVDNFQNYFKEILSEIVKIRPEILKSKETEKLDFILSFNSREEMINAIAEKKINSLFYLGINDIKKYFSEKLNVEIFKDREYEINLIVKQRNLAVHNRSVINKEFITEFPNEKDLTEGLSLKFDFTYVEKINHILYSIINDIDKKLSQKYNLPILKF
ncbi:hypothetical protein EGI16_02300 [Chryseobacterium sp. G0240]|uniref:hypothetical protein n=1 Tax=Chryseobacterium sp. G0240 TaxID=2487066 RepID=UPI000F45DCE5|nr:hypothetical protein [Chryseobacterium sp. G0240]ROI06758.1 hypothetical protein EGI16_02300 [Chryseobacterium sp. G0240]